MAIFKRNTRYTIRNTNHKKQSFTLIELIVVIAIIAVLAAIIAPNAFRAIEKAKVASAIADLKTEKNAMLAYYADTGEWPPTYDSMNPAMLVNNLIEDPGIVSWDGPYVETWLPHPWGGHVSFGCDQVAAAIHKYGGTFACAVVLNDDRPGTSAADNSALAPLESMVRIDELLDDGNLATNDVQGNISAIGEINYFFTN